MWGRMSLEILPSYACTGIQTHIVSVKFRMCVLLAGPEADWSPQATAGILFGHQI